MTGNDVVDLRLAACQSNWRRKGFLNKVFSAEEQGHITSSKVPDQMVWLLWSMKEAAYKAHQRQFRLPRKLNWQDYSCSLLKVSSGTASGVVRISHSKYFTTSEISEDYVYTSAETSGKSSVKNGIFKTSSEEMKRLFLEEISEVFKLQKQELKIEKDLQGIPFVSYLKKPLFEGFSFSGHGRYCAFSLAVNDL